MYQKIGKLEFCKDWIILSLRTVEINDYKFVDMLEMNKYFIVSLCRNRILGDGMFVDLEKVTYKTRKVTVPEKLKSLEMRYEDIVTT